MDEYLKKLIAKKIISEKLHEEYKVNKKNSWEYTPNDTHIINTVSLGENKIEFYSNNHSFKKSDHSYYSSKTLNKSAHRPDIPNTTGQSTSKKVTPEKDSSEYMNKIYTTDNLYSEQKDSHFKKFLIMVANISFNMLKKLKPKKTDFQLFLDNMLNHPEALNAADIPKYIDKYEVRIKKIIINVLKKDILDISKNINQYTNACKFALYLEFKDKKEISHIYSHLSNINTSVQENFPKNKQLTHFSKQVFEKFKHLYDEKYKVDLGDIKNPDAKTIINEIESLFLELNRCKLDVKDSFDVKNLYLKRLPQVIDEYLSVPSKSTIKNKPLDELLLGSLTEIREKLNLTMENVQETHINKMKSTHKYLKSYG